MSLFFLFSEGSEAGRRVLGKAKVHRRALEALPPPSAGRGAPLVQSYQGEGKGEGSASPSPLLLCVSICRQYVDRAHVYFIFLGRRTSGTVPPSKVSLTKLSFFRPLFLSLIFLFCSSMHFIGY